MFEAFITAVYVYIRSLHANVLTYVYLQTNICLNVQMCFLSNLVFHVHNLTDRPNMRMRKRYSRMCVSLRFCDIN